MIQFGIKDMIDILLVAFMLYYMYKLMKRSSAVNIFSGIIVFLIVWIIFSQILNLKLMGTMLNYVVNIGALALVVLFQEEIRRFLSSIGTSGRKHVLLDFLHIRKQDKKTTHEDIMPIILACINMSRQRTGALIVIQRNEALTEYINSGDVIDANISQRLIENIFFKNSPLHDGAMIVRNKRIAAAGCILPVSHNVDIPRSFGLRHRSALGIAEKSDALAIVVSEETGAISVANEGVLYSDVSTDKLEVMLSQV